MLKSSQAEVTNAYLPLTLTLTVAGARSPRAHGFGSGFIIDPQGVIVTNHHVVDGADEVLIELRDGRKFVSKDIKSDPKTDLAIVRFETKEPLPHLTFGDSSVTSIDDLHKLLLHLPVGVPTTMVLLRGERRLERMVLPQDFPDPDSRA